MTTLTLSKAETAILTAAAGSGGGIHLPGRMKPASAERFVGMLMQHGLARVAA